MMGPLFNSGPVFFWRIFRQTWYIIFWEGFTIMRSFSRKAAILAAVFFLVFQATALAAGAAIRLNGVRFSQGAERDRIVFDLSGVPDYLVTTENDGQRIVLDLAGTADLVKIKPAIVSDQVQKVSYRTVKGRLQVLVDLAEAADYEVKTLKNPARVFIDIKKEYERQTQQETAPGLVFTKYVRRDGRGLLTAYFLDVDRSRYTLAPVLANGIVLGRETVSSMSDDMQALAAINATYFAPDGEIIGLLRLDGTIVGTTYFTRSSLGLRSDGSAFIAPAAYNGSVTIGRVTVPVSGVNIERGENNLIIYNKYFNTTTGTNNFGREFVVQNGKVTAIQQANSQIPADGVVISVHGTSRDAFTGVHVGDKVTIREDVGALWAKVPQIIGGGPMLLKDGKVNVTVTAEQFPNDIARGRAPRTAVGLMPNNHLLLAVVDGRQDSSIGCTLTEWAELLQKFGARDAINFDGGGSSEMVVGGQIMNSPSDGRERPVGSALAVLKK